MTVTPTSSPNFARWMKTPNDRMTMTRQSAGDCKPILSDNEAMIDGIWSR